MSTDNKTVLIVDDEKSLTDSISVALQHEEHTVLTANSGEEGLQTALQKHPDLILLDIQMADMSGLEVLKQLRNDDWGAHATVIMMTVADDTEKIAEAVEHKVDSYILKTDLKLTELVETVKKKLG